MVTYKLILIVQKRSKREEKRQIKLKTAGPAKRLPTRRAKAQQPTTTEPGAGAREPARVFSHTPKRAVDPSVSRVSQPRSYTSPTKRAVCDRGVSLELVPRLGPHAPAFAGKGQPGSLARASRACWLSASRVWGTRMRRQPGYLHLPEVGTFTCNVISSGRRTRPAATSRKGQHPTSS